MTGFGSYGNGGGPYPYASSSPSSLSALAPPFTGDGSVPKPILSPLVDVTEPPYVAPLNSSLHNWLPSRPPTTGSNFFANPTPEFNSMPSSKSYIYAGLQTVDPSNTNLPPLSTITAASSNAFTYDQSLDAVATSYVEMKPYYPSYLSPTIHGDSPLVVPDQPSYDWLSTTHFAPLHGSSHKDYPQRPSDSKCTAQWGSLWNGLPEWEQGKQGDFGGSFCSKKTDVSGSLLYKNYMNQEPHSFNSLNSCAEAYRGINILDWEKPGGSVSAEHLGDKSFGGNSSKSIPLDFSKSVMGSLSAVPETQIKAPSSQFITKNTNCTTPYSVTSQKWQHDASLDDITSSLKSSPAFVTRPPTLGTKSSEPEIGLLKSLNFRSDPADTRRGDCYPSSVQESQLPQVSEGKVLFDSSQLGVHLGTIDCFSLESSSIRNEELSSNRSVNKDVWDHAFKAKSGLHSSHVSPDGFNVALNKNETINSVLTSSDNVDPNNPPVDSPCWKGVPGSRFSSFEASKDGVPENQIMKLEENKGLNIQMPPMFPLKTGEYVSSQEPIKNTVEYHEFGWPENVFTLPLKRYSVANSAFGEHKLDDTVKTTYYPETSHDRGPQSYEDVHKSGNKDKFIGLFERSHTVQQGHGDDGLTPEVKHTTWSCAADVKLNINDKHVPSPAVKNVLCCSVEDAVSSVEDAVAKLSKSNGEESIVKVDVQMLVNTIDSLSELLLMNCSDGSCQLKKNDLDVLKSVIKNLNTCILKNAEMWPSMQESPSFQRNTSRYNGELSEHHKVVSADRGLLAPALDIQDQVIGSVSVKSDVDMVKEDKMTQAIKKILCENFHDEETDPQSLLYKNLWLEAEAVLCSINYKARFNRVKIEMDMCKAEKSKDKMDQSMTEVFPDSNLVNQLTCEAQGCPTSNLQDLPILSQEDDVLARFRILRERVENSIALNAASAGESSSTVSPEPNKVERIAPEANGFPSPGISIQDSPTSSTAGQTNDYDEASVVARFHILRDLVEDSKFINSVNTEETSSSKVSLEPKIDVIAPDTSDHSVLELNIQDSSQANDHKASIMDRFHILRDRVEDSKFINSVTMEETSSSKVSLEPKIDVIAPDTSDRSVLELNIQDSGQADDHEAYAMDRFRILRDRVENSKFINSVNMEETFSSKVSLEPRIDISAPDTSNSSVPEFNIQDSSQANDCEASVISGLHILKYRVDCSYMDTGGKQLPEPKVDVIAPDTSDSFMPKFNIQDSLVSSTGGQGNDREASVMSRLDILKSRPDNCAYMHTEGQQLPEIVGPGYAGKRNPWQIMSRRSEGGSSDLKEQPILQSYKADNSEGKLVAAKEFHLFVEDDPLTQYHKVNRHANLLPSGSHDSCLSDWEHVMKEEIWGQNC